MSLLPTGRQRLACDECTRKKIKCDKTVPCSNCTKRGLQDACTRGRESDVSRQLSAAVASAEARSSVQPQQGSLTDLAALVTSLSARLAELENAVKETRSDPTPARPKEQHHLPTSTLSYSSPAVTPGPGFSRLDSEAHGVNSPLSSATAILNTTSADSEAASILEFLAWGRRKPGGHVVATPKSSSSLPHNIGDIEAGDCFDLATFEADPHISLLQTLFPSRHQIEQLVAYHEDCLLWYHGSFFPPVFREQLASFFDGHNGDIEHRGVDLQWAALLFSIMTGSMCCAPSQHIRSWGFQDSEKSTLSKQWHRAVLTCLHAGEYMTRHKLVSCEAIATLTLPAHLLGCSNNQSVLLASAVRIAQSLGLHRLSNSAKDPATERGRRVWCQLCTQDWFGIPFLESYTINPLYSQTSKPTNCHEDDLAELSDSVPTRAAYPRFLYDIARLMPQLQDGMLSSNTVYTKYEQVIKYDMRMRALANTQRPLFLSNAPVEPEWPRWVPWGRRSLTISSAHKIIMIHRQFLGQSFTNLAFSITRKTCVAAAKTILKEQKQADDTEGPQLWIYDAFSVTACIILCFDILHLDPEDQKYAEHRKLVEEAVEILRNVTGSMIAKRGVCLVSALLSEADKLYTPDAENPRKRKAADSSLIGGIKRQRKFDMASFIKRFCDEAGQTPASLSRQGTPADPVTIPATPSDPQSNAQNVERSSDVDLSYTERLLKEAQDRTRSRTGVSADLLSPRGNFENVSSFENLLFLAQTYDI